MVNSLKVEDLVHKSFGRYGRLLVPANGENADISEANLFDFYILFSQAERDGWRAAFLNYRGEFLTKLERHVTTVEVFIPLRGHSVIVVATEIEPFQELRAFYLDKPLIIDKGIWHNVVSIGGAAEMLVVENAEVDVEYFDVGESMGVVLSNKP